MIQNSKIPLSSFTSCRSTSLDFSDAKQSGLLLHVNTQSLNSEAKEQAQRNAPIATENPLWLRVTLFE